MPIFSAPKNNPLAHYYTNSKNAEDTEVFNSKERNVRKKFDDLVYAKQVISRDSLIGLANNNFKNISMEFWVRLSSDRKKVFDTRVKYCLPENNPNFITKTCKNHGEFIQVNQQVFEKYLDFLDTESESQFKECNRLLFGL
jgi:hypothetical protein